MAKTAQLATLTLDVIIGGGQTLGTLDDGRKALVWGGLPGERVTIRITKKKSHLVEGVVTEVHKASPERIAPHDPDSYLSTSPWQIMDFAAEQHYKAALIEEAFELHDIVLPNAIDIYTDEHQYHYRNKVEFSWYGKDAAAPWEHKSGSSAAPQYGPSSHAATESARRKLQNTSHEPRGTSQEGLQHTISLKVTPTSITPTRVTTGEAAPTDNNRSGEMLDQAVSADFGDEQASGTPDSSNETLDLAFFRRGSKGKVVVDSCSLLPNSIMNLARAIRDLLRTKPVAARNLKTLLIRCDQQGNCVWQLYLKDRLPDIVSPVEAAALPAQGGELIYSDPRSPASRITERLAAFGDIVLTDTILGASFRYATEGFFQVNVPVYEQALRDMVQWVKPNNSSNEMSAIKSAEISSTPSAADSGSTDVGHEAVSVDFGGGQTSEVESSHPVLDLYSGVGTIGLTIGGDSVTLVEVNEDAVREMRRNIKELGRQNSARAILAPSEKTLDYITSDATIIVDPPRAGLHADVIAKLLDAAPQRIIYLSCNPVTQARDVALLAKKYGVRAHQGYNFFPRTPHIEHLVILDRLTDISPHQT